ncbi:MAG: glycosyltransferase family 4 protein [Pelagimonas sp.]|jgi:glycosyltransferase involved in cell wall biosynthesis|nr:glycosyltransferase family 4 protein [Pelagimonas sp.]
MQDTILLITKDAPTSDRRKAGLFPVAIRHHLELNANIMLFSITGGLGCDAPTLDRLDGLNYLNTSIKKPAKWVENTKLSEWKITRQLIRLSKANGVTAVCGLQSAPQSGILARKIGKGLKKPYASWEHLTTYSRADLDLNTKELKYYFSNTCAVAAVSEQTLNDIEDRLELKLENRHFIPNPVPDDFEKSPPPHSNKFQHLKGDKFAFGAWTNWRSIKRLDLLLDAFGNVAQASSNSVLFIAGPIPEKSKSMINQLPFADRIHLLGNVSREDIRHLAHAVDCCCLTSDFETFGLPVVEALAAGRPVVSTDTNGPKEIITEKKLGYITPRNNSVSFANAMKAVMQSPQNHPAEQLRQAAIERYGEQAQIQRWRRFYQSMGLNP